MNKITIIRDVKGRFIKGANLKHPVYGGIESRFKEGHKNLKGSERGWFKKGSKARLGISPSFETRKKISISLTGIKDNEWKGFSGDERQIIMHSKKYIEWRKQVFQRDNYICQVCERRSGQGLSLFLEAHHILRFKEYPKLRFDISNGITLCKDCHSETLKSKNTVGVIGSEGWVGNAMIQLFKEKLSVIPFDIIGIGTKVEINKCSIAFICVPTPYVVDKKGLEGKLDTSIVEECISWCECPLIVIRSTVNPGDCDRWTKKYNKNIVFMPEYLGETPSHPMLDPKTRPFLIIGGEPENRRKLINLYTTVYNANITIRQVTNYEAEVIKLSENRAIALKVASCQELYDVCEKAGVDYYTIRDAVYGDDPRFNLWWTFIFPDKRGFNSKCMPKDIYAWCAFAESLGYKPEITRAILERNKKWIKSN